MRFAPCFQRFTALILQHHIRGAVRFKKTRDTNNIRMAKRCKGSRLFKKAVQTGLVKILIFRKLGGHGSIRTPIGKIFGKVFFDGDADIEIDVFGQIGNAEATLPKHNIDLILEQLEADRQRQCLRRRQWNIADRCKAACRAVRH